MTRQNTSEGFPSLSSMAYSATRTRAGYLGEDPKLKVCVFPSPNWLPVESALLVMYLPTTRMSWLAYCITSAAAARTS